MAHQQRQFVCRGALADAQVPAARIPGLHPLARAQSQLAVQSTAARNLLDQIAEVESMHDHDYRYSTEEVWSETLDAAEVFAQRPTVNEPERRLMAAVLGDALSYFQRYVVTTDRRAQRLYADAEQWFASRDPEPPFSFESVCNALALDARRIRKALFEWRDARRAGIASPASSPAPTRRFRRAGAASIGQHRAA